MTTQIVKLPKSALAEISKMTVTQIETKIASCKKLLSDKKSMNPEFTSKWISYYESYLANPFNHTPILVENVKIADKIAFFNLANEVMGVSNIIEVKEIRQGVGVSNQFMFIEQIEGNRFLFKNKETQVALVA